MTKLIKIENNTCNSCMRIAGRNVRFISYGGSSCMMTRIDIQRRVRELSSKDNLRASSLETLAIMRKAEQFALENGL